MLKHLLLPTLRFMTASVALGPQKGDFQQGTALPSLNVNVLSLSSNRTAMKSDNDNDAALPTPSSEDRYTRQEARTVGRHLAMFLEKTPEHIGGFVNKCKQCTRT